jgi:hypothetical protein
MSPSSPFSWRAVIEGLNRPGPPPTALPGVAFILLAFCLAAVVVLVQLGHVWHDDPHRYFGERKTGTYLSFLNLVATGVVAALIARRLRGMPFARFWWVAAAGFVWMGCDDLFVVHERLDRAIHAVLGLDPEDPVTDHLDDAIVGFYGVAALALAYAHRADLAVFRWMILILALAFPLFAGMVVADALHLSKTVEDVLKVVAGTLILVGFLAAWLQLAVPGDQP